MATKGPLSKRHRPLRTCIICRTKIEKNLLVRIIVSCNYGICIDKYQNKNGRGSYICKKSKCQNKKGLRDQLSNHLQTNIPLKSWSLFAEELVEK